MEQLAGGGGGGGGTRLRHHHRSERFLGIFHPPPLPQSSPSPPLELSEDDIFSTSSGTLKPNPNPNPNPNPTRGSPNSVTRNSIYAALSGSGSGSDIRPVFNHKASVSSFAAISPASSPSSPVRIAIPRRPPAPPDRAARFQQQSAPVNVPVMAGVMRRNAKDFDDVELEEEEVEMKGGVILPPHEVVASRDSPRLACSVLEGAGRTLKGRDLRQVRNAIWRKTGFID